MDPSEVVFPYTARAAMEYKNINCKKKCIVADKKRSEWDCMVGHMCKMLLISYINDFRQIAENKFCHLAKPHGMIDTFPLISFHKVITTTY